MKKLHFPLRTLFSGLSLLLITGTIKAQSYPDSAIYSYTGSTTTFTVPACVSSITVRAWGAGGGGGGVDGFNGGTGGGGGYASRVFSVNPGDVYTIQVGGGGGVGGGCVAGIQAGAGGYGYGSGGSGGTAGSSGCSGSGGGGGGGTFLLNGSTVLLAAGGGGGGGGGANAAGSYGGTGGGGGQNGATNIWAVGGASGASSTYNGLSCGARSGCDGAGSGGGGGGYLGGAAGNDDVNCEDGAGSGGAGGTNYGTITIIGNGATPGYGNYPALPAGVATGGNYDQAYGTNPGGGGYVIIEYNSPIQITPTIKGSSCLGNDGSASITVNGGGAPFTYSWSTSPVQTGTSVTGMSLGTYTVTVHDANGCSNFSIININSNIPNPSPILTNSNACLLNGVINTNVTTGTAPFTYTWTPSGSGPILSNLSSGSFTVSVTDALGCTGSATATISNMPMVVSITSNANTAACLPTGIATANAATNGTSPYTYAWTPSGGTNLIASNLSAGAYTITATDANGCSASSSTTISTTTAMQFQTSVTQTYTYSTLIRTWTVPAGITSVTVNASGAGGGRGRGGSAGRGATISGAVVFVIPGNTLKILTGGTGGTGLDGGGGGGGTFVWDASNTSTPLVVAGGGGGGGYIGLNLTGKSASTTISALNYTSLYDNITQVNTNGGGGGSRIIEYGGGGGAGFTGNGGTGTVGGHGGTSAIGGGNGGLSAPGGGTGGFGGGGGGGWAGGGGGGYIGGGGGNDNYSTYDAGGGGGGSAVNGANPLICSATNSSNGSVTINYMLSPNPIVTKYVSCNGEADGSLSAPSVTGGTTPYTYSWAPSGGTNSTASNLSAATYTITITDASGCSLTSATTITQPVTLVASASVTANISCNGGSTGTATANPSNGTLPYTYLWNDGSSQTTATANGLSAGSYSVIVQDNCGASQTNSVTITQPIALSASANVTTNVSCNGNNNGSAIANPINGTSPYTYLWSDASSQTSNTAGGLVAGNYTVTVQDICGSLASATVTITQPATLSTTASVTTHVGCNGGATGNATANPINGVPPYTYTWTNSSSAVVSNSNPTGPTLSADTYTVTVHDNCGTIQTTTVTITQPDAFNASWARFTDVTCFGAKNGTATPTVTGGNAPYTYEWSSTPLTAITITLNESAINLAPGYTYKLTISDANGCSTSITTTVTQPATLVNETLTLNAQPTCHGYFNGVATANPSGGTPGYKYVWSNGETNQQATALNATTVSCKVIDANGCNILKTLAIGQPTIVSGTFSNKVQPLCNGGNGSMTVTGAGGTPGYSYSWAPVGGTASLAGGIPAQTYTVTVTDNNGCTGTAAAALAQPAILANIITRANCVNGKSSISVHTSGGLSPYTYAWSSGSTLSAIIEPPGTYSVSVTDKNHCNTGTSITFSACPEIRPRNGFTEEVDSNGTANLEISVYPNPNTGQFTLAGIEKGMLIEMYDFTGRKITSVTASDISEQLNLSNQSNGIYLIRILDKEGNLVTQKKVVKTN